MNLNALSVTERCFPSPPPPRCTNHSRPPCLLSAPQQSRRQTQPSPPSTSSLLPSRWVSSAVCCVYPGRGPGGPAGCTTGGAEAALCGLLFFCLPAALHRPRFFSFSRSTSHFSARHFWFLFPRSSTRAHSKPRRSSPTASIFSASQPPLLICCRGGAIPSPFRAAYAPQDADVLHRRGLELQRCHDN